MALWWKWIGFILIVLSFKAQAEIRCEIPAVFPYSKVGYGGFDGNRENNQRIACDIATKYSSSYLALPGNMVFQPITFSADAKKLYATIMSSESCTVYEVTLATGVGKCLDQGNASASLGNLEIDYEGNLYYVLGDAASTADKPLINVISRDPAGNKRWQTQLPRRIGAGSHFTPDGYLAVQGSDGVVTLLSRKDGRVLTAPFDIPKFLGLTQLQVEESAPMPEFMMKYAYNNWTAAVGEQDYQAFQAGAGAASGSSSFAGNTIGVTRGNQLLIVLNSQEGGFLVALSVKKDINQDPFLQFAWKAKLDGSGSATTPSISPDGRYVSVGDTAKGIYRIDISACNSSPASCTYEWKYLLASNIAGNPAIDEKGRIYTWNQSPDPSVPDFLALDTIRDAKGVLKPVIAFSRSFPGMAVWDASATVYNNIILGGVTTFSKAGITHELVGLNRQTGATVFSYPMEDDSTNNIAVGPDGAIYVPVLGMIDLFLIPGEAGWKGGVKRFAPLP